MSDVTFVLAAVAWGVLPGWLLLAAFGFGESQAERLAAAVGLSIALVAAAAYSVEIIGLPVAPLPVALLLVTVCVAARVLRTTRRPAGVAAGDDEPSPLPRGVAWLVFVCPAIVAVQLGGAMSYLLIPPTLHDGLDHANWFRLIYELQSLDPAVLLAPPLGPDGAPTYYPFGMHAFLALVAQSTSLEPHVVLMRGLIGISAALPLSVFAFVAVFTGRSWTSVASAFGALIFWWLPYQVWGWGGYAMLAGAVAGLPVARLALASVARWHPAAIVVSIWCGAGLAVLHPSQAWAALIVATVVAVTRAAGRVTPWTQAVPFTLGLAGASAALAYGPSLWEPIAAFMAKAETVGAAFAADPRALDPIEMYFRGNDLFPPASQVAFGALYLAGVIGALRRRTLWPIVALHAAGLGLLLLAPSRTWVTSLWYHSPERIWDIQYASLPAFAGIGLGMLVAGVNRAAHRWHPFNWRVAVWPALAWIAFAVCYQPYAESASRQLWTHAHQNPQLTFADERALADFAWLRAHVAPDALVFNAPADWGLPLPFSGRRMVFWSGGYAVDPTVNWNGLLSMLRAGDPHASQAAAELARLGIQHVYAARLDSRMEAGNRLPLRADVLRRSDGLDQVYESETATIFAVRHQPTEWLGVRDSARISYHNFTPVQVEHGREWRWTAETGRIRLHPSGLAGRDCHLRILGPLVDTYEVAVDGETVRRSARGLELPDGLLAREFVDLRLRWIEGRSSGQPADAPPPVGVRITDMGVQCANRSK